MGRGAGHFSIIANFLLVFHFVVFLSLNKLNLYISDPGHLSHLYSGGPAPGHLSINVSIVSMFHCV